MRVRPDEYLKHITCLYIEDEKSIREPFLALIEKYFKKVVVAENGQDGLEKFSSNDIDIIISDIRMPVMNGIEMAKHIREIDSKVFIIFVTAFDMSEYLKEAIDIGVEGYITKPLNRDKLFKKLNFLAKVIKNEKDSEEYLSLLQAMLNSQSDAICLLYKDKYIKLANQSFKNLFGEVKTKDDIKQKIDLDISAPKNCIECKIDNETVDIKINIKQYNSKYKIITFVNITQLNKIYIDELTRLYNRKILEEKLVDLQQKEIYLIMFDIDDFKHINDTYGHNVGDIVLQCISSTVVENVRKDDTIIRWGGEEFIIILNGVRSFNIPNKIAEVLRSSIEKIKVQKINHPITCSFGICKGVVKDMTTFLEIVKKADEALYSAKREGKNRVKQCQNND